MSSAADPNATRLRELRALAAAGATSLELAIHLAASGYDPERAAALLAQLAAAEAASEAAEPGTDTAGTRSVTSAPPGAAELTDGGGAPIRVWASFERARLSPEAWGQFLRLRADGMGDAEFEHLVDRALLQLDGPVGIAELRALLGDAVDAAPAPPTVH